MAVKIKLTRLGKIRNPQYRIAVADARTRRDGRSIEVIGRYHPKEEPSLIEINSERAQYWLSVGAQPTEPVLKLLKITGDWQKFKGLPGAEGRLKVSRAQAQQARAVQRRAGRRRGRPDHRGHQAEEEGAGQEGREGRPSQRPPRRPPSQLPPLRPRRRSRPPTAGEQAEPSAES